MSAGNSEIAALIESYELALLDPAVRRNRARVLELLAEDFREFGASGREWTLGQIVDLLATEDYKPPTVADLRCQMIGATAALITYRSVRTDAATGKGTESLRSSLWTESSGRWQMRFHQGTPAK